MNDTIVIGGETTIDGQIEGQANIDTEVSGEFGTFYPVPVPEKKLVIKDVMFMDYDGTVVASYDKADFVANVTALPTPPAHNGLTFQEWNWTLSDIKDELTNGSGACCIGAHYTTADGKTHFYIDMKQEDGYIAVSLNIQRVDGTVVIEWGDGQSNTYTSGTTLYTSHTYADYGEYVITVSGNFKFVNGMMGLRPKRLNASSGSWYNVANYFLKRIEIGANATITPEIYDLFMRCPNLETVSTHKDFLGTTAPTNFRFTSIFAYCTSLKFFVFPKIMSNVSTTTFTSAPMANCFIGCASLVTVSFPKKFYWIAATFDTSGIQFLYFPYIQTLTVKGGGQISMKNSPHLRKLVMKFDAGSTTYANGLTYQMLMNCYGLETVTFSQMAIGTPNSYLMQNCNNFCGENGVVTLDASVTVLTSYNFQNVYGVRKYVLLGNVTSVGAAAFYYNYACMEYDFTHCTAVPTLANTNAFTGIMAECKIKVPASLVTAWKAAANWSTYASYIEGV